MIELDNPLIIEYIEPATDTKNRPTIKMYSGMLKHAALILSRPAMLMMVGIDHTTLSPGKTPTAFFARWEWSENEKSTGNRYQNVTELFKPNLPALTAGSPTPATSDPESANLLRQVLAGLLEIREMLIADGHAAAAGSVFDYFYADGEPATIPEEKTAFNDYRRANDEKAPASRDALREWWKAKKASPPPATKPATRTGRPLQAQMN